MRLRDAACPVVSVRQIELSPTGRGGMGLRDTWWRRTKFHLCHPASTCSTCNQNGLTLPSDLP